ncbi:MAG TPA: hypothetical protein VMV10_12555 [Pirellulales bacterium]|nr:hypothetical protein [Pirellulales bacterium]
MNGYREDRETFRELFWDLFREGIITLGLNDSNRNFPHFSISRLGHRIIAQSNPYFFHDVSSYEKIIRENVPQIDPATLTYLKESMQAFKAGCVLASTIILGVAAEHTFMLVARAAEQNAAYGAFFERVEKKQWIAGKLEEFKKAMEHKMGPYIDVETSDGMEAMFNNVQEVLRDFRNKCGHPTGKILSRDMAFVLLQLFIPYSKKAYELKAFFEKTT